MVTQDLATVKRECDTPLSSVAYFPASTKNSQVSTYKPKNPFASWVALKRANRVKRGNTEEKQYRMDVHADMVKITRPRPLTGLPEYKNPGGGIRGKVTGFSRESRKRLIEFMSCVRNDGFKMFLTMTYDDDSYMRRLGNQKADFEAFRKRFERGFPQFSAIWRVETQERKSGILKGTPVPHFHLIVYCNCEVKEEWHDKLTKMFQEWGTKAWQEIVSSTDKNHLIYGFHCTPVRNRKQALSYIGKYIGKVDRDKLSIGRRWGRIGQFDSSASAKIRMDVEEIIILRRLIKRWLRNKNREFASRFAKGRIVHGFSIFGLGDCRDGKGSTTIFEGYDQFLMEVRRQRHEQECGHVCWNS